MLLYFFSVTCPKATSPKVCLHTMCDCSAVLFPGSVSDLFGVAEALAQKFQPLKLPSNSSIMLFISSLLQFYRRA